VTFINPTFWIVAVVVYILLSIETSHKASLRFGFINLFALNLLLGWQIALGALLGVTLFWGMVSLGLQYGAQKNQNKSLVGFSILAGVTVVFIFHKLNLQHSPWIETLQALAPWMRSDFFLTFLAGLSFSYIFVRCADALHCVFWKNCPLMGPLSLFGYLLPFHMLLSGPVNAYEEHLEMDRDAEPESVPSLDRVLLILNAITTGLLYKFVVAESLRTYFYGANGEMTVSNWGDSAILALYVFFDFAGYSRVARGLGLLYRVPTPENFSAPFLSVSVTDFWTRWHMSMGQFVRRNLFTPIQLNLVRAVGIKNAGWVSLVTMVVSFGFVGLWHRISWTWILWGVAMGLLMALEKHVQTFAMRKGWNRSPWIGHALPWLGPVYTNTVLIISVRFVAEEIF